MQGELAHRLIKRLYDLTNKKNALAQIGKKYSRKEALHSEERQEVQEATTGARLDNHHYISPSRNTPVGLFEFVQSNPGDPAKKA